MLHTDCQTQRRLDSQQTCAANFYDSRGSEPETLEKYLFTNSFGKLWDLWYEMEYRYTRRYCPSVDSPDPPGRVQNDENITVILTPTLKSPARYTGPLKGLDTLSHSIEWTFDWYIFTSCVTNISNISFCSEQVRLEQPVWLLQLPPKCCPLQLQRLVIKSQTFGGFILL